MQQAHGYTRSRRRISTRRGLLAVTVIALKAHRPRTRKVSVLLGWLALSLDLVFAEMLFCFG